MDVGFCTRIPIGPDLLAVIGQSVRTAAGRLLIVVDEPSEVVARFLRRIVRMRRLVAVRADRRGQQLLGALHEHVSAMVLIGERHVERVPYDRDIGHRVMPRHPVERRMGLDEPPVRLGFEQAEHLGFASGQHVEPGRERADGRPQVGSIKQKRSDDRLHPRGPALRRCRNHDVVGTKHEPLPPRAIRERAPVAAKASSHSVRPAVSARTTSAA